MFNIQQNRFAMKVKDFEDAINRMDTRIVLDEVKLSKGNVRRFYGHIGTTLIMWKENGTGHTCILHTISPEEVNQNTHDGVTESCYTPEQKYDIKFENI